MKPVPYLRPTNIRRNRTKRNRHGDPKHGICTPLHYHIHKWHPSPRIYPEQVNYDACLLGCNTMHFCTLQAICIATTVTSNEGNKLPSHNIDLKDHTKSKPVKIIKPPPFKDRPDVEDKFLRNMCTYIPIQPCHISVDCNLQVIHVSVGFMLFGDHTVPHSPAIFFPS